MMVTKEQLAQAAKEALNNWDPQFMQPGQTAVLEGMVNNPSNFSDNEGMVEIPDNFRDIWDYLEEVSVNLASS